MITLQHIKKSYKLDSNELQVLKDVNLEVQSGTLTYLVGESGSGKSTLLNIIGGIDTYDSGTYYFENQDISTYSEKDLTYFRREKIGFVFQNFNLISHLSAIENVELSMVLNDAKDSKKRAMELLKLVGMDSHANHLPNQLSGGQKQRVAIARALANNPDVILADEPTGALDSENSIQVMEILRNIADQGKTVIVVTHSTELLHYGDVVIRMKDGEIIDEDVHEIKSNKLTPSNKEMKNMRKRIGYSMSFKLASRNIKSKKWRNFITAFAAAIGIIGILIISALSNGINEKISTVLNNDVQLESLNVSNKNNRPLTVGDLKKIHKIDGIKDTLFYNAYTLNIMTQNNKRVTSSGEGFLPQKYEKVYKKDYVKYGNYPKANANEIVIPERLAKELFKSPKKAIGQNVTITSQIMSLNELYPTITKKVTISGILQNESIKFLDTVGISYNLSNNLAKASDGFKGKSLMYIIIPKNGANLDNIKKAVSKAGYSVKTEQENNGEITNYVSLAGIALGSLSAISLIVSSIMIGIVLYIGVVERTKEIGILKAIGAYRKDIRRIFICEGLVIGLLGGIIGSIVSWGICLSLNWIIINVFEKIKFNLFQMDVYQTMAMVLFSGILGLIASFIPANMAAKQVVLDSLRYE